MVNLNGLVGFSSVQPTTFDLFSWRIPPNRLPKQAGDPISLIPSQFNPPENSGLPQSKIISQLLLQPQPLPPPQFELVTIYHFNLHGEFNWV